MSLQLRSRLVAPPQEQPQSVPVQPQTKGAGKRSKREPGAMPEAMADTSSPRHVSEPELAKAAEVDPVQPGFVANARAAAIGIDKNLRQQDAQTGVLRQPEPHRNLQAAKPELETRLAADFSRRFGEEVMLSVEEKQEGSERVTVVKTNKGLRCGYTRIINPYFMRDFPALTRWGDCAK